MNTPSEFSYLAKQVKERLKLRGVKDVRNTRKIIRNQVRLQLSKIGKIGPSEFARLALRRERRAEARKFVPQYNGPVLRKEWK